MTIKKNGSFVISPMDKLSNNHIYDGKENYISVSRNYTTDFECKYKMHYYPFDIQHCIMEFILGVSKKKLIQALITFLLLKCREPLAELLN